MKVLLTGAFGNIGLNTLNELLKQGQQVRCFDLETSPNKAAARKLKGKVDLTWGDLRDEAALQRAVEGMEAIIHLGFVIPHLSTTGVKSEEQPDFARDVNVGGTRKLLSALSAQKRAVKFIFASSLHVFGRTQEMKPPRRVSDPVRPVEEYAKHKVECERMVRESGLKWTILRLGAALPIRLILDSGMFEVPLDNRIEYLHGEDAGLAFANAVQSNGVWGKTLLIGGGKRCQFIYRDLMTRILDTTGVGLFPEEAFAQVAYSTDWLDTSESQALLNFQQHTLDDYLADLTRKLGWRKGAVRLVRPIVRQMMLRQSPYYSASKGQYKSSL